MARPNIEAMTLRELANWVTKHNNDLFDTGEFPAIDDLTDDEELSAREEYEGMAEEIIEHNRGVNMKTKTADLIGSALDWAVAKCEGRENDGTWDANFSNNWLLSGPIIEREGISIERITDSLWDAYAIRIHRGEGPTPLIAAMRCFVASKLGDEIEVPGELK